jgi:hypothetical protein
LVLLDRARDPLPLNTVTFASHVFLRVRGREGAAAHLTPSTDDVDCTRPRSAVGKGLRHRGARARLASYDGLLLEAEMWAERTMCGLLWAEMASHEAELTMLARKASAHDASGYVCRVCAERAASWS